MKKVVLDFAGKATPAQIHDYLYASMGFPEYYGRNLDALYDCLSDVCEPTCVGVYNLDPDNSYHESLAQVLRDAQSDNSSLGVFFAQVEFDE
ncbi:MAG: barstar family protein [Bacteroidales bacterium]|nr:barstar family protein [Bacteroidales bacterium]